MEQQTNVFLKKKKKVLFSLKKEEVIFTKFKETGF